MPLEKILATSAALATDDLDWESARRAGLTSEERDALIYFADIESQTILYLRDLLASRLAGDPEVVGFLAAWNYEEYFHGRALARLLAACGAPLAEDRLAEVRRASRALERVQGALAWVGSRLFAGEFPALYMAWGAAQELTTLRGYEALRASTANPVLAELCRRIARQERRHFAWYYHAARERLAASASARRLARFALSRFYAPVGAAVKGPEAALHLVACLFPGGGAEEVARDVDARIAALPGLGGLELLGGWLRRARGASTSEVSALRTVSSRRLPAANDPAEPGAFECSLPSSAACSGAR